MTSPTKTSEELTDVSDEGFEIIDKSNESLCSVSAETYLSLPEEILALSSVNELKNAIENCKSVILSKPENSEDKKWLVRRLIELRLRLENIKDTNGETTSEDTIKDSNKVMLGHHFTLQNLPTSTLHYYCDRCSGVIWNILHSWYMCSDCKYKCHVKCLSYICRVCAHVVVSENPEYILEICPEAEEGLANQNYRCAECLAHTCFSSWISIGPDDDNSRGSSRNVDPIVTSTGCKNQAKNRIMMQLMGRSQKVRNSSREAIHIIRSSSEFINHLQEQIRKVKLQTKRNNVLEPRLCDYTGKYYCSTCHWNSTSVIPARIILNWDFKERNVCRSSKQILKLLSKLPILKLEKLNPVLFACIEELGTVKELRQQLMQIKKYLTSCRSAGEEQLLWQHGDKVHFLENEDSYSLQDLLDLRSGDLIKYLNKIRNDFIRHIQVDCEVCKGRGFFCELCKDKKIIFPFEENVMSCSKCHSAFHFFCWIKNNQQCPKCYRIQQRLLKTQEGAISNAVDS